jgi:hypothetical protein
MALILFWFGSATLMLSLVVGLQEIVAPNLAQLDYRYFAVPIWGLVAVSLALAFRKRTRGSLLSLIAGLWLASAFAITAWIEFGLA